MTTQVLSPDEIIRLIRKGECFDAQTRDGGLKIKIERYVPYVCTAIHAGSKLRESLKTRIALDDYQRWYEEDPHTDAFISSMPITLVGCDSRYEYDLNRRPVAAIYETAWGKDVWKKKLSPREQSQSLRKHHNYYRILRALVARLEERFEACIVYDMHSYNWKRWDREVPLFNIGTVRVDQERFGPYINHWKEELEKIQVPNENSICAINDVFEGLGYNLEFLSTNFSNTLVLATEVKKVYCDETNGIDYPDVIRNLQRNLKTAILNSARHFIDKETSYNSQAPGVLLHNGVDPSLLKIDRQLHKLLRNFELLAYVNPINIDTERKRFFKKKYNEAPHFRYGPIKIHPFELKQSLSNLKTQEISDVSIRYLYEAVINSYFDKVDLLASLNSKKFLYNSLRYFGRPSHNDLQNAQYLSLLPAIPSEPKRMPYLEMEQVIQRFEEAMDRYKMKGKIELSKRVISQVMVLNSRKTVLIRPDAHFTERELGALIEHELGVHMVTTQNSNLQDLKIFNLGLPVNTRTQEGLAILAELLSGNITLKRLKKLATRVKVVDMMCNGADFNQCFRYLHQDEGMNPNDAFSLCTRIFRGGGFTKDYLYLSGFVKILRMYLNDIDLSPLLVGKTSTDFYDTLVEMIDREIVKPPLYKTHSFTAPKYEPGHGLYDYILSGLQ
tara:strand:- start:810 stop:2819 length:2010 start_codon:yes stop_codon:yes gene_type:complete